MIEELGIEEFNEFSSKHENGIFFQTSYWGNLKQMTGWVPLIVGIKDGYNIKGATLLLAKKIPVFNKYIFYAPRGYLLNYNSKEFLKQFTEQIVKYVKKKNGIFLKINPYLIYQERDKNGDIVQNGINNQKVIDNLKKIGYKHNGMTLTYGTDLEPRWLSILDIKDKTEAQILKEMDRITRWTVNNSYKHGLKLVEIDETRINEFKKLMEHTGERRGFIDRPLEYYKEMYKSFKENDNIKIMLVEFNPQEYLINLEQQKQQLEDKISKLNDIKDSAKIKEFQNQLLGCTNRIEEMLVLKENSLENIVIAGGLFMTFGKEVVSLFGASYRDFMKYKGQYFLNFEMIKYAINNNYEKFNFFGISGEFNKESELYGLFDFKRGFGAKVVELIGEFNLIINPLFYGIYQLMYKIYRKMKG